MDLIKSDLLVVGTYKYGLSNTERVRRLENILRVVNEKNGSLNYTGFKTFYTDHLDVAREFHDSRLPWRFYVYRYKLASLVRLL